MEDETTAWYQIKAHEKRLLCMYVYTVYGVVWKIRLVHMLNRHPHYCTRYTNDVHTQSRVDLDPVDRCMKCPFGGGFAIDGGDLTRSISNHAPLKPYPNRV